MNMCTDGDASRRIVMYNYCSQQLFPIAPIYVLGKIPLLDLPCGPFDETVSFDLKHLVKRCWCAAINGTISIKSILSPTKIWETCFLSVKATRCLLAIWWSQVISITNQIHFVGSTCTPLSSPSLQKQGPIKPARSWYSGNLSGCHLLLRKGKRVLPRWTTVPGEKWYGPWRIILRCCACQVHHLRDVQGRTINYILYDLETWNGWNRFQFS